MGVIKVHDLIPLRALVTRESAQAIAGAIDASGLTREETIVLDFAGIEAVTPSFVDEVLGICEDALARQGSNTGMIAVVNPPTRLSSKFTAVARGRGMTILESADGSWTIRAGTSNQ